MAVFGVTMVGQQEPGVVRLMSKTENECKTAFCADIRGTGGYARRIEDQYGVGIPDIIAVPRGGPVFLIEAKIMRTSKWGASQRQGVELGRFRDAAKTVGDVVAYACELGFDPEEKIMTIRQYGVINTSLWWNYKFPYWNSMGAEYFLKSAHEFWENNNGR